MTNNNKKNTIPSVEELTKQFPYIHPQQIKYEAEHNEYKTAAGFLRFLGKINARQEAKATTQDVKQLTIKIEWKKSKTWGYNPHAEYWCTFADGSTRYGKATCSGCGYDKASTVIADAFNECCIGMLWRKRNSTEEKPYGVYLMKNTWFPYFDGGIGVSCYARIAEFLGGKFETVSSGKNYDHYVAKF